MMAAPGHGRRLAVVTLITGIAVVAGVDVSYAYYSSHGSGTGTATTGAASITLPTMAASVSGLYPGAIKNISVTVTNTSPSAIVLTEVTPSTATITIAGPLDSGTTCEASAVTFTPNALPGPIGVGQDGTVTGKVAMASSAGNQCQGATFSIGITVTGHG